MRSVVFDANALLMPFQFGLNLDMEIESLIGEFHGVVPSPILGEVRKNGGKWAKAAVSLARKYEVMRTEHMGDASVMELGKKLDAVVVTNDEALQEKLRDEGIPYMYMKNKSRLVMWDIGEK